MKKNQFLFSALMVAFLFMLSCNRFDDNNNTNNTPITMEDLIISNDFDWSTTQEVQINITAKDNQGNTLKGVFVEVYTGMPSSGGLLMAKGVTDANGKYSLKRSVSSDYQNLVLATKYIGLPDYVEVPIEAGMVNYTFGGTYVKQKSVESITPKSTNSNIVFLGGYNSAGLPDYLEPVDDVIDGEFMADITNTIPEGQHVNVEHPEFLLESFQHDLILECAATVWVTFVHEAASYRNVLGFYTYNLDDPPTSVNDIGTITIIYPNTSYYNSGGGLHAGNKVEIGTFPDNTGIGWVLIADGFSGGTVTNGRNYYYSERNFNPESNPGLRQHLVMINDPARERVLLGWEDIQRDNLGNDMSTCDHDFNDCVYYFTVDPLPCTILDIPVISYTATDSDGDGVPDHFDDYPANASLAFNNYYPCNIAYGTLAFEDLWPGKGDYDFNDLVTNYQYNQITNGENKIVQVIAEYIVRAHGAYFHNGFGIQFEIDPTEIASITGQTLLHDYITLNANNTEAGQSKATVIIFDDTYDILPHPGGGGIGVNTEEDAPYVDPVTINIEIELTSPFTSEQLGYAPFNPFIISNGRRGYEIHLPDYPPTDLQDVSLFGTEHDNSNPASGRYYKTDRNLPWAIDIWAEFDYPIEKTQVVNAYTKFAEWAESDGVLYTNWYEDIAGYRIESNIYEKPE